MQEQTNEAKLENFRRELETKDTSYIQLQITSTRLIIMMMRETMTDEEYNHELSYIELCESIIKEREQSNQNT